VKAYVLRRFTYGADGIHGEAMEPGTEFECRDDLAPGLLAAGFVRGVEIETRAVRPASKGDAPVAVKGPAVPTGRAVHKAGGPAAKQE
jgi:hypothetical protein